MCEVYAAVAELLHDEGYATPLHGTAAAGSGGAGGSDNSGRGEGVGGFRFADFLGHGLGIDVHEDWIGLDPGHEEPLREGDVVTVEPELYRKGWGCVRLEDVVLVTADGCRTLSRFDYELI